ncbi:hypothetical protein PAMP_005302 [Pampus punctatissimus]
MIRDAIDLVECNGMFGKCHSVPVKEVYTYDVSPSVVQRFRMLLEKLSNRVDASWCVCTSPLEGDRDLCNTPLGSSSLLPPLCRKHCSSGLIRRIGTRRESWRNISISQRGDEFWRHLSGALKPVAEAMDPVDQRVKPVEVELSRNLQTYLQRLGLLPKTPSAAGLNTPGKSDRFLSGIPADFYRSKAQTVAQKASPSSFSSLSSFQPLQKQRPPADELVGMRAEGDLLLGALRRYLSGHLSLQGGGLNPEAQQAPSSRLRPFYSNGIENSKSRLPKMGRTQESSVRDPLTYVDERFIQNVLKNVGMQHLDVDKLTPQDLDQLSSLIADALQVVDRDKGPNMGLTRVRPGPRDLEGELKDGEEEMEEAARDEEEEKLLENDPTVKPQQSTPLVPVALQERHTDTEEHNVRDKPESGNLFTKLLAYLDKTPFSASPSARNRNDVAMETPMGQQVGLENVQSRTSEAGMTVQKKDATQSVEEVSEVEGWIKEVAPPPASLVYEEPHKKTVHVPELQLDVKANRKKADDDVFGYVITDTESLHLSPSHSGAVIPVILASHVKADSRNLLAGSADHLLLWPVARR